VKRVAIIAAMPGELLHLARGWKHEKRDGGVHLWRTTQGDAEWVAACAGAGQAAATRAFAEVEKGGDVTSVISTGWVGALTAEFVPGRVYAIAAVIDAKTGERFEAGEVVLANGGLPPEHTSWRMPANGRNRSKAGSGGIRESHPSGAKAHFDSAGANGTAEGAPIQGSSAEKTAPKAWVVTSPMVAGVEEKARLAGAYAAGLVDMESAAVARLAAMRRIPFYCIKGVSDGHASRLPDFNRFLTPEGQFQLARFIFFAILRPWYWPELMRMSENSSKASQALRDSLLENLRRTGAI
jgi:nucleoside phosphorylase